jgi:hypothetical protein
MSHRILFTSPLQPISGCSPNVYSWDKPLTAVRIAMSFLNHPGLAFLKANLPCDTLEYPTENDFQAVLARPPEILGISFYINESALAVRMAKMARQAGVREVWGGNYGVYSPEVAPAFDRMFTGWGESQLAEALGSSAISVDRLRHPEMYGAIGTNLFPHMLLSGLLFTSRGCPWTCNFCQTPSFYGKPRALALETIDRILWTYHRNGIRGINILDENFGTFRSHADEVVDLLHRYQMRWIALTRVDTLSANFDRWLAKGLFGAHLGIESLNQKSLIDGSKKIDRLESVHLLKKMSRHNLFVQCFYIFGFEHDTVASIEQDIEALSQLDADVVQVQVLTPYPLTQQRDTIVLRYGIHDPDLSHYNSRNLVWNHPHISPAEMRRLQDCANRKLSSSRRALRTLRKFSVFCGTNHPNFEGLRLVSGTFSRASRQLHRNYRKGIHGARQWAQVGWYAYEEQFNWNGTNFNSYEPR